MRTETGNLFLRPVLVRAWEWTHSPPPCAEAQRGGVPVAMLYAGVPKGGDPNPLPCIGVHRGGEPIPPPSTDVHRGKDPSLSPLLVCKGAGHLGTQVYPPLCGDRVKLGTPPRVLLSHPRGGGNSGPTHPQFWHTHRPTNVPPPPPGGGGLTPTHPPTHPPTHVPN